MFEFQRNEHEHLVIRITGFGLLGTQEVELFEREKRRVSYLAERLLTMDKGKNEYDAKHRLDLGKKYRIVLFPGDIVERTHRTTERLCEEVERFHYGKPVAGVVPEAFKLDIGYLVREMGLQYIAALHDPFTDEAKRYPIVLGSCHNGKDELLSFWDRHGDRWCDHGAFLFFDDSP